MLPTFIICGAPKAGTTSLFDYLSQHPDIFCPSCKEPMFFANNYQKGLSWYESLFKKYSNEKEIGEASSWYMRHELAPKRIYSTIPHIKLIFVLRNPIDRAFSAFWHGKRKGSLQSNLSFSDLIRCHSEINRIVDTGLYYEQIVRYKQYFSLEQMHFVLSEELHKNLSPTLKNVFRFLNVEDSFVPERLEPKNVTSYPRSEKLYNTFATKLTNLDTYCVSNSYLRPLRSKLFFSKNKSRPQMNQQDRNFLLKIYQQDISMLSDFLNKDLSLWQ